MKSIYIRSIFVFLFFFGYIANVSAILYIQVSGGQETGLPVAVVPFSVEGANKNELEDIATIIKADLENSGQFLLTAFHHMNQHPHQQAAIQPQYWKSLGVDNVVVGRVMRTNGARFTVNFELVDVIKQKAQGVALPLLAMQFDNIHSQEFRALAHHMSDLIFEKLIGVKGVFSTRIAYISIIDGPRGPIHTLEVADSDGFNPKILYRSAYPLMSPAWSPDGKKIAFVSFDKERASTNVVEIATGHIQRITQFPGMNNAPAWSPDGRSLAVVLSKEGSPKIYKVDLASSQLTRLTSGSSIDTEPSFTPDGRAIVFTSSRGGKPQVYKVTLETGKIERLTFSGDYNARPSITPDGKRLILLHRGEGGFSIAVQSLNTGDLKVLTRAASLTDCPTLAPNGMMVLYGSGDVLAAVSLDGRINIRLPAREGTVKDPAWAPFPPRM
jgi:TolB protein